MTRRMWRFSIHENNSGRLLSLETSTTFEELKAMVAEDYVIQ